MSTKVGCGLAVVAVVVAAGGLVLLSPIGLAQEGHEQLLQDLPKPQEQKPAAQTPPVCDMCTMQMSHMVTMAKLKEVLAEAKAAAEADNAKLAVAKIVEAEQLLEQQHQSMHKQMKHHMHAMHKEMMNKQVMGEGAKQLTMKCPMCVKPATVKQKTEP